MKNIRDKLKKGLENVLCTLPIWGIATVAAVDIAITPMPTNVTVNGQGYAIFQYDDRTVVRTGSLNNVEFTDLNKDGVLDSYREVMGCRHGCMVYTLKGERIPTNIQDTYTKVMAASEEQKKGL